MLGGKATDICVVEEGWERVDRGAGSVLAIAMLLTLNMTFSPKEIIKLRA